jgi:hypothetical protein
MQASLDEEREMSLGTQPPIGHEHITRLEGRMDRLGLCEGMGQEGGNDQLQEHTGARMEESQEVRDGQPAPRPLLRRLAERVLEDRGIGPRACRAIDEEGAMPRPPPVIHGGALHRAAEALEQKVKEVQREFGTSLTGGRRREPSARQMGQMTAGGVAVQNLPQEELHHGHGREHAVAPPGIAHLATHREHGFRL